MQNLFKIFTFLFFGSALCFGGQGSSRSLSLHVKMLSQADTKLFSVQISDDEWRESCQQLKSIYAQIQSLETLGILPLRDKKSILAYEQLADELQVELATIYYKFPENTQLHNEIKAAWTEIQINLERFKSS